MTAPSVEMFEELDVLRSCCRSSFRRFIREAWHLVPGAGAPVWNWHMWAIADEMQRRAEDVFAGRPRRHDVVINISPGTSKSTICSILFHPWTWTRMPTARHLNASHTSDLVLDLAYKSREVIRSEWYRQLFPEVVLCDDADAKGLFRNTAGGDRLACTVAGRSPMGFHAHFITCLSYESRIITDAGELPIGQVVEENLGVHVLGWDHDAGCPAWNVIESWQKNQPKPLTRVSFSDGTLIELTEEHPVFVKGRGYVPAIDLGIGDEVIHASRKEVPGMRDRPGRPLSVVPRQDAWPSPASLEVRSKVVVAVERAVRIPRAVYNLGLDQNHNFFAEGTLVHNCDDPIDPKKVLSAAELKTAREFMTSVLPTRKVDKKVSVTFLIMQRLHAEDPTAVMLETSRKEGATPVKHYCLPAELLKLDDGSWDASAVKPRKLASRYVEGVMDPGRLDRRVLNTFRAQLGAYGFAGQFLQSPTPPGGGMFKATYFNQRVKAAPYHAKRIRYWDRACLVAGTMVETIDGPKLIESIVAGELVLTRNGYRRVSRAGMTKCTDDLVRATFSNGAEIVGTPDHLTWSSSGWIPLSSVASDRYDFIALGEEGSCSGRGCESSEGRNPIPNALSLMGYSTPDAQGSAITKRFAGTWRLVSTFPIPCTEPFGGFTTGTYRQGTTFTTAMGIGTTTTPAIWNACLERITTESTIRLRRGTARQKPLLCESGTCARHGRTCRTANGRACIAEDRLRRGILIPSDRCIAQRSADGSIKIPSWIARAFGADNRSRVVRKPITACSVERIWVEKPVPVYDLTVEGDPEFFANGILVHNSTDGGGCRTAGVLLALADDGNFYIEHVVAGQWEPTQRNEQMRATAIRDKLRYGPKNAPVIWVEAEGGSSGRDAWKGVAAALVGFPVREDRVTGSKVTRAEPWSAQLAARNVFIVDNGGSPDWDVQGYVDEHVSFPLGKLKDVVDASSGAFNLLVGRKATPQLRVLSVGGRKGLTKIVSCSKEELGVVIVDEPALLIVVEDPPPPGELASSDGSLPPHSCLKLVDGLRLTFADVAPSEVQSAWNEPLEPYGRKPEELIMRPEDGKRLWAAISKKRPGPAPVLLFVDDGGDDRRALSVAMGVSDVIGQPRSAIHRPSRPDEAVSGDPPNAHVHSIVKSSRSSVV